MIGDTTHNALFLSVTDYIDKTGKLPRNENDLDKIVVSLDTDIPSIIQSLKDSDHIVLHQDGSWKLSQKGIKAQLSILRK